MSASLTLSRIEGGLTLDQQDDGSIRLTTGAPRGLEERLTGRAALEAIYLAQQCGADASVSHAIAAAMAWEDAAGVAPPRNGVLLREFLQGLSFIHAHLRQFYVQAMPDYLPWADLATYRGSRPELQRIARTLKGRPASNWARQSQPHPFSGNQVERLQENQARAIDMLDTVQRMMARVAGKFPMVMSIVPGGCTVPLTDALLIELRQDLQRLGPVADGTAYEDAVLVAGAFARLGSIGRTGAGLQCVGALGEGQPQAQPLIPSGLWSSERFMPLTSAAAESIAHSYYQLPPERSRGGPLLQPAPNKAKGYSWIKAPRRQGLPMEVGPLARMALLHHSVPAGEMADLLDDVAKALGGTLTGASSIAGRMVARQAEVRILMRRCGELLDQMAPGQPTLAEGAGPRRLTGTGTGEVEAPAGSLRHRATFDRGAIAMWDIIGPSTWNGSPRDQTEQPGPIEAALAQAKLDLNRKEDRLTASRLVHSFAFSSVDAVQ